MKRLPVPPLAQTLEAYLRTVRPLLEVEQYRRTAHVVAEFLAGDGPECQAYLEQFADTEHLAGRNWFSQAWVESYLGVDTPLPLTSNYSPEITWPDAADPVKKAADLVHRLTQVCLTHLRAESEPLLSARGDALSMEQWAFLAGGARHPQPAGPALLTGPERPDRREVVVLREGHAFTLQVTDDAGAPLGVRALEAGLREIHSQRLGEPGTFTHLAHLGNAGAARHLDRLLMVATNRETYQRLVDALFVVNLVEHGSDRAEHLRRTAFGLGQAWPLKPTSYQICLDDGWTGVQVEHTVLDGGTMDAVIARAQAIQPAADPNWHAARTQRLGWEMSEQQSGELAQAVRDYLQESESLRLRVVRTAHPVPGRLTTPNGDSIRLSADGVAQWVMAYAQLATFGQIRNTYESVAMLEYQAGRTEALRPATPQAVRLAQALLNGDAHLGMVEAAGRAHSAAVVTAKTGSGMDRHLLGLRLAAQRLGLTPEIFADPGYQVLCRDFLSTTSLGSHDRLGALAFAPTSPDGLGINYASLPRGIEFCVTWRDLPDAQGERFIEELKVGASRFHDLVTG